MYKKLLSIVFLLVFLFSFTGCESNEINLKIITDGIIIQNDNLMLVEKIGKKPTVYKSQYKNFNLAIRNIKQKYDKTPFLSHSKVVIISAEITVNELSRYIKELKKYYQVPPDIKIALAENSTIDLIEEGKLDTEKVNIYIKNISRCDSRICVYENNLLGQKFPLLYESDGNINIKRITI